jgi:NAD(P)-dependent dehydrogenase (short-subunit alcohol dehydrogenase family)
MPGELVAGQERSLSTTDTDLSGKTALVTGGGGGVGRGIALELAAAGADVTVADIDAERAGQTAEQVRALGRRAVPVTTDVMDVEQVRVAVKRVDDEFGRIDILVNNAGGVSGRRFLEQSERSWRRHIDINLVSMLAATSATAPIMIREGRGGSIVNVTSIEGTRAAPTFAVYAACKAGMISFTRTMAVELAEHAIRVNAIAPDWTRTPGNSGVRQGPVPDELPPRPDAMKERLAAYIPLGREGAVDECGKVAVFLSSPMASYVTGAVIPVDGGTWASSGWTRSEAGWSLFGREETFPPAAD